MGTQGLQRKKDKSKLLAWRQEYANIGEQLLDAFRTYTEQSYKISQEEADKLEALRK